MRRNQETENRTKRILKCAKWLTYEQNCVLKIVSMQSARIKSTDRSRCARCLCAIHEVRLETPFLRIYTRNVVNLPFRLKINLKRKNVCKIERIKNSPIYFFFSCFYHFEWSLKRVGCIDSPYGFKRMDFITSAARISKTIARQNTAER